MYVPPDHGQGMEMNIFGGTLVPCRAVKLYVHETLFIRFFIVKK